MPNYQILRCRRKAGVVRAASGSWELSLCSAGGGGGELPGRHGLGWAPEEVFWPGREKTQRMESKVLNNQENQREWLIQLCQSVQGNVQGTPARAGRLSEPRVAPSLEVLWTQARTWS